MTPLFPAFASRAFVFGVLNVTPDSFSDGGRYDSREAAVDRGMVLAERGADVIDVGGESTRPGAVRVDAATEAARVIPVIRALHQRGIRCSVDTTRAAVAAEAIGAGAQIINDVSGGLADPEMAAVAAATGAPWILMHWRGHSAQMQQHAHYGDVVAEVTAELLVQVDRALRAGVDERSLVIDPGLGFAKNAAHNWALLHGLHRLVGLGLPVLVGASRKRFLGELLAGPDGELRPPAEREAATAAVSVLAAQAGAWAVRVHEPQPTRDALAVLAGAGSPAPEAADPEGPEGAVAQVLEAASVPGVRFGRLTGSTAPGKARHG